MEPKHPFESYHFFHYSWDVAAAWRLIEPERPVLQIPLEIVDKIHADLIGEIEEERWEDLPSGGKRLVSNIPLIGIDPARALTDEVDLSVPTLWIPFEKSAWLIDGWHRLHKAHITRQPLLAYRLTEAEAKQIEL